MSDGELEDDSEGEKANGMVAFTTRVKSKPIVYDDRESSHEDLLVEYVVEAYKLLYLMWKE